ncbi:PREDICTED: protein ECERIFERUM 1-like [Erythranthe guttata]|uniref:protein ECERIFERUM 1-like n=1 Tax=Erythranthe guttata TaxID=4155 RepID=UPI00064DEF25|nr:PREDICTED: protein ECERIFERUM 1-like [Erythranthe guttata]|eukprot:XP_012845652.1 PREDICTED: protein ECERIFERUM 1-like [Erythranthe guttata]
MAEEGKRSRVKVESILSVVSSNPTRPGKVHKLSLLDQSMGPHTIHIVFYYGSNPFSDGPMSSDLENFRVSLSDVLDEYPVVTGRLTRGPDGGGWQVKCNDAGVRVLQARVDATVDEWLRSADVDEERDLTVWEDMPLDPSFWSPFRIQVNNFKCGGLAIGLSCTHMHADITSATLLIKSWADYHSTQTLTYPPIFTLPTHTHPQNTTTPPPHSPTTNTTPPPTKMATVTMKFSGPAVEKCLSGARSQCPDATPFDVLVALLWSKIAHWQEPHTADDNKRSISICTDSRGNRGQKTKIPLGYFGNALSFSVLTVEADELSSGKLGQVCEYVHRHVVDRAGPGLVDGDGEDPVRVYGPQITCVSTEHLVDAEKNGEAIMYSAVFDNNNNNNKNNIKGEKPLHVSYSYGNVVGEGLIVVVPTAEVGPGRAVTVTLPEEQIDMLCKDQEILDLEGVMVISGGR